MAVCTVCDTDMLEAEGCVDGVVVLGGIDYSRITDTRCGEHDEGRRCHDCGCMPGHFHHLGCDNESCPKCGDQLFVCGC